MKESRDYHCLCGKLLCKGAIFDGEIQIKCRRCGNVQTIKDLETTHHQMTGAQIDLVRASKTMIDTELKMGELKKLVDKLNKKAKK